MRMKTGIVLDNSTEHFSIGVSGGDLTLGSSADWKTGANELDISGGRVQYDIPNTSTLPCNTATVMGGTLDLTQTSDAKEIGTVNVSPEATFVYNENFSTLGTKYTLGEQ
jgi:hypothetical protein